MGELFERYTDLGFLVAMKYVKSEDEAKDVVMQVFEKMLQDLPRYEVRNFKFWFHTVVKNQALATLEKGKRTQTGVFSLYSEDMDHIEGSVRHPYHDLLDGESLETARIAELPTALERLRPEQKTCIELFYLKKQSYKEVSEQTGYTLMQVKSFIQNGKRNLKNDLSNIKAE